MTLYSNSSLIALAPLFISLGCAAKSHGTISAREPVVGAAVELVVSDASHDFNIDGVKVHTEAEPGTRIAVTVREASTRHAFEQYSRTYEISSTSPSPVRVSIPFAGGPRSTSLFWAGQMGGAFRVAPTRMAAGYATAEVVGSGELMVASACVGDDCCAPPATELDLLLDVDNSNSMVEEQEKLRAEFPGLFQILASGDVDGDGVQDFPSATDIHAGVVSTDMAAGGWERQHGCSDDADGDAGALLGAPDPAACPTGEGAYESLAADGDATAFVSQISCRAAIGVGGCGFEQQLASMTTALASSDAGVATVGESGQANRANAGFLREDSVVAIVSVTDEDDCSIEDQELFNPQTSTYPGPLNLRCHLHSESLSSPETYANALQAIRRPERLVFGLLSGLPLDAATRTPTDLAADPSMTPVPDATNERVSPVCTTSDGEAAPAQRLTQTAIALEHDGAAAVLDSICQDSFRPFAARLAEKIGARLAGSCEQETILRNTSGDLATTAPTR